MTLKITKYKFRGFFRLGTGNCPSFCNVKRETNSPLCAADIFKYHYHDYIGQMVYTGKTKQTVLTKK